MPHLIFLKWISWSTQSQILEDIPLPKADCSISSWNVTWEEHVYFYISLVWGSRYSNAHVTARSSNCYKHQGVHNEGWHLENICNPKSWIKMTLPISPKMHKLSSWHLKILALNFSHLQIEWISLWPRHTTEVRDSDSARPEEPGDIWKWGGESDT